MLEIVIAVRMEERAVQTHPSFVDEIVSEWQARVLVLLFGQVLFDSSRADGTIDGDYLTATVWKVQSHEKAIIALFHASFHTEVFEIVFTFKVALHSRWQSFLCHAAVKGASPGSVMVGVAGAAV
jgi:hypothetical protein